jgi:hypothetical protein
MRAVKQDAAIGSGYLEADAEAEGGSMFSPVTVTVAV